MKIVSLKTDKDLPFQPLDMCYCATMFSVNYVSFAFFNLDAIFFFCEQYTFEFLIGPPQWITVAGLPFSRRRYATVCQLVLLSFLNVNKCSFLIVAPQEILLFQNTYTWTCISLLVCMNKDEHFIQP